MECAQKRNNARGLWVELITILKLNIIFDLHESNLNAEKPRTVNNISTLLLMYVCCNRYINGFYPISDWYSLFIPWIKLQYIFCDSISRAYLESPLNTSISIFCPASLEKRTLSAMFPSCVRAYKILLYKKSSSIKRDTPYHARKLTLQFLQSWECNIRAILSASA